MDIDVTVDIDPYEVLEEMKVKDIIKYLINQFAEYIASSSDSDFQEILIKKLNPWDMLIAVAKPFIPRNCTDKQAVLDGIKEFLSRQ
mgnify:CR=1 FL=1